MALLFPEQKLIKLTGQYFDSIAVKGCIYGTLHLHSSDGGHTSGPKVCMELNNQAHIVNTIAHQDVLHADELFGELHHNMDVNSEYHVVITREGDEMIVTTLSPPHIEEEIIARGQLTL